MEGIPYNPELATNASAQDVEAEITFITYLMSELNPDSASFETDRVHYEQTIAILASRIASLDPDVASYDGAFDNPVQASSGDSSTSSYGFNSNSSSPIDSHQEFPRKRSYISLAHDLPDSKRPSLSTSPAPASPAHVNGYAEYLVAPTPQHQAPRPVALSLGPSPSNSFVNPYAASSSGYSQQQFIRDPAPSRTMVPSNNVIDLTGDDSYGEDFVDPFHELHQAYRDQPMMANFNSAFHQNYMNPDMSRFPFALAPAPAGFGQVPHAGSLLSPQSQMPAFAFPAPAPSPGADDFYGPDYLQADEINTVPGGPEAIANLIENIKPDEEVPPELRESTPRAMRSQLMEHQKLGLKWLMKTEEGSNKGGILADEMGLGKTVQALALILARPSTDRTCKTTLVIAPVALMRQWEKELQRHVHANYRLKVYVYHGNGKKADFNKLRQFDVVLTTFGTLASELKQKESRREAQFVQMETENSAYVRPLKDRLGLLGRECMWYRIIIDEAQCIKNRSTLVSKAASELQARHRLCMTGTPMMNSVDELYPMLRFLRIKPYNDWLKFSSQFSKAIKNDRTRDKGMRRLQALLKSIMLRRQKTTVIDGEEICKIPPKKVHHQSVDFQDAEREIYKAIETKTQLTFNKYLKKGTVSNHYAYILVLLLRLRQACCHPHLITDLEVQVSTEGIPEDDLKSRAKDLTPDVVNRLKDVENFECPICLDGAPNPTIFLPCGHTCCGECFQKLVDPSQAIREGNEDGGAKCPHCRGRLSSEKITDYRHFCKVHCPEKAIAIFGDDTADEDLDSDEDSALDTDSDNDEVDEKGNLKDFVVPDDESDDFEPPSHSSSRAVVKAKVKGKDKIARKKKKPKKTLAQLKKESVRNKDAKRRYLKRLRDGYISSSKIDRTVTLVSEIRDNDPTEKILIFSQFTSLLDLVEVPLQDRGFKYQRYDGSMKMDDRADAVNKFMDEADQQIMLISLKAGNAGLNLNKASQVIILDPFWNPFVEDQAVDRAHRMPQQREVHVHRILVPDTVENRICDLQEKKRELISSALDENAGRSISRLGLGELMYLFGIKSNPQG